MAIKTVYIGSEGPFKYDDTMDLDDPDGLFPGVKQGCIVTDGELVANVVSTVTIDISGTQLEDIYDYIDDAIEDLTNEDLAELDAKSYFCGTLNG